MFWSCGNDFSTFLAHMALAVCRVVALGTSDIASQWKSSNVSTGGGLGWDNDLCFDSKIMLYTKAQVRRMRGWGGSRSNNVR